MKQSVFARLYIQELRPISAKKSDYVKHSNERLFKAGVPKVFAWRAVLHFS